MLNANEYYHVAFLATTEEDDYNEGCTGRFGSSWTDRDVRFSAKPKTIEEALMAVCEANYLKYTPDSWEVFDLDEGRIDGCFTVDENNCEATEAEIEAWKQGEKRLWMLDISCYLTIRADRAPTKAEMAEFKAA